MRRRVGEPGPAASPGTASPSGPPNFHAAMTSAVATAIATRATPPCATRAGRGRAAAPARDAPGRRVVLADREAGVVLVDERLAVEAERLRVRAQEPADVRRCGQDVEPLVLEGAEVLRTDLRPLLELGEVEVLTEAGLAEAGADVEHEGGSVVASNAVLSRATRRTPAGRRPRAPRAPRRRDRGRRCRGRARRVATRLPLARNDAHRGRLRGTWREGERRETEADGQRYREPRVEELVAAAVARDVDRERQHRDGGESREERPPRGA